MIYKKKVFLKSVLKVFAMSIIVEIAIQCSAGTTVKRNSNLEVEYTHFNTQQFHCVHIYIFFLPHSA